MKKLLISLVKIVLFKEAEDAEEKKIKENVIDCIVKINILILVILD